MNAEIVFSRQIFRIRQLYCRGTEADFKEIEDTVGALGAAIEALDSLKSKIEVKNRLEELR